jgi:hypothetical protein
VVAPMMEEGRLTKSAISSELSTTGWDRIIMISKQETNFMYAVRVFLLIRLVVRLFGIILGFLR